MGLQFIFVVETNAKCKSDWIYLKDTIEHFYKYDQTQIKFSPVYMDGKGKYKKKEIAILCVYWTIIWNENKNYAKSVVFLHI